MNLFEQIAEQVVEDEAAAVRHLLGRYLAAEVEENLKDIAAGKNMLHNSFPSSIEEAK